MDLLNKYAIIGIGEFSHGIKNSWEYRLKLLKLAMRATDKKIIIFNEMSVWQAENVMHRTIYDRKANSYRKYEGFKKEQPINMGEDSPSWGAYWQYVGHSMESEIVLKIFRYIRKNDNRITLIGIDNDKLDRDHNMAKIILSKYDTAAINFFWAHNAHVSDTPLSSDNLHWIKNKAHRWYCGYYLRKKLKSQYCIILSQARGGKQRFNSYCRGKNCAKRVWGDYFYKKFSNNIFKKVPYKDGQLIPAGEYMAPIINFSNSYFENGAAQLKVPGASSISPKGSADYILFWNVVEAL